LDDLLRVLALVALVAANAFFVIGEYSVVTARRGALAAMAESGRRPAQTALRLMDDPVRVISTVQVGITAIGILTGALGEPLIREILGDGLPVWVSFAIAFSIVTYATVVFGELVPKALTLDRAERLAVLVAPPIDLIARVLRPAVWVLERSAALLLRPFGVTEVVAGAEITSAQELRDAVDAAEQAGVIPRAQEEMLHSVFDFPQREVRDVMVPAPDVLWLDATQDPGEAFDRLLGSPFSRAPVGRGSLDDVIGIVHIRDLARARSEGLSIGDVARPLPRVPETRDLGGMLRDLRDQRIEAGLVLDEWGRTVGLVTIEDLVEEIVGEIEDEFDLPDNRVEDLGDGRFAIAGSLTVDDANEQLGVNLPKGGPRTVAGIVFDALGRLPEVGDEVEFGGSSIRVDELDGQKIARVVMKPGADG
jgi:putative hemolysin